MCGQRGLDLLCKQPRVSARLVLICPPIVAKGEGALEAHAPHAGKPAAAC